MYSESSTDVKENKSQCLGLYTFMYNVSDRKSDSKVKKK